MRVEFRRIRYLALKTLVRHGTPEESRVAQSLIKDSYSVTTSEEAVPDEDRVGTDAAERVERIQNANAVLLAPISNAVSGINTDRASRRPLSAPVLSGGSRATPSRKCRRALDDDIQSTVSPPAATKKRQKR
jgi:hypothetical protein